MSVLYRKSLHLHINSACMLSTQVASFLNLPAIPKSYIHICAGSNMHSLMQVTSESDVKNAVQVAREKFGGLNVAVN